MSDNIRIAKNTVFLYIRMLFIMIVSLYTSRVVLDKLGVDDYGLYYAVCGVVTMLSFISGTLSFGTYRFITCELGVGNKDKLKLTFSTALCANIVIAGIMLLLLETGGLWFVHHKLVIPPDRFSAAMIVYQISLVTMLFNILQIPFQADIIAHEKMNAYAYIGIFEAIGKLSVCFLITLGPFDNLINYALFWAIIQIITACLYIYFSHSHFSEVRFTLSFDRDILKKILGFSGWNIAANMSETFKLQGIIIVLNMFFQPAIVGAQAVANQIANAIMQFVSNFRTAIDPQVIKLYAAGDYEASKKLTLRSAAYTFDLILLLALPSLFTMNTILNLWLVEVPDYCVVFAQWAIIQRIPCAIDGSFFTPIVASGNIKRNAIYALSFCITQLLLLVFIFKIGGGVMWVQYIGFIFIAAFSFCVKPIILHVDVNYGFREILVCFANCCKVLIPSVALAWLTSIFVGEESIMHAIVSFVLIMLSVVFCSVVLMEKDDRAKVFNYITKRLLKRV